MTLLQYLKNKAEIEQIYGLKFETLTLNVREKEYLSLYSDEQIHEVIRNNEAYAAYLKNLLEFADILKERQVK